MAVVRKDFTFTSTTGDCEIHAASWKPKGKEVKAVFQMAHGMAEHLERYDEFARFMAEHGYAVYMNDHIGHGKSTNYLYPLGYFGMNNHAGDIFVSDCKLLLDIAKQENPDVPMIFFGHSMGSLVARKFADFYSNELAGAVFCGTVGPNPLAGIAIKLCDILTKLTGVVADGKLIDTLAFGTYNDKTEKRTKFDWLSTDSAIVDKYIADPECGFYFSNRGYRDLLTLLDFVNSSKGTYWLEYKLPVLVISGEDDPCGEYGAGVDKVINSLMINGNHVDAILYPGARHEILNEFCKDQVMNDILAWADKRVEK